MFVGSGYFLSRTPPRHFKEKSTYKPTDATRFSVGTTVLTDKCRQQYGDQYVAVLAPDQPWHLDIRFALPNEPLPTGYCRYLDSVVVHDYIMVFYVRNLWDALLTLRGSQCVVHEKNFLFLMER